MKRIPMWQTLNAIVITLFGLIVIWWGITPTTGLSAPMLQGGATATPTIHAQLQTTLVANDAAAQDDFGISVGISGDTIVVGADEDEHSGLAFAGAAYVYVRSGTTWTQQAKLTASDAAAGDSFGYAVAISGDTIVVGAYHATGVGSDTGAAYVYVREGTTWTEQQKLIGSDTADGDLFGWSVSLDTDTIVVGAYGADPIRTFDGAVYIFVRSGTTWTEQQKLTVTEQTGWLGYGVDIDGDTIVAGATAGNAAYVFQRSGTTWTQEQRLSGPNGTEPFGEGVAIDDNMIIVGNSATGGISEVFIFVKDTTWQLLWRTGSPPISGALGYNVDIFQGVGLAAASRATYGGFTNAGMAQMLMGSAESTELPSLWNFVSDNPNTNEFFGWGVARDGWTVVVTQPLNDHSGLVDTGAAYVYTVNGPPWVPPTPTAQPTSITISENEFFVAIENAAAAYSDIVTIVPDFVPNAINMTIAINGAAGNVTVAATQEEGFVTLSITNMTLTNGAPAPANYVTIISRDLPQILTAALDSLVIARFGSLVNVQSITINGETMTLSTLP